MGKGVPLIGPKKNNGGRAVTEEIELARELAVIDIAIAERRLLAIARRSLALVAAVALAACMTSTTAAAQGKERSGKEVVDGLCIACHGTGASGAPRIGDKKAWAKRGSAGLTSLTKSALEGIRQMPPHGGNPNLTDTEIERAITYMVNQSGGHWTEPISRTAPAVDRSGEEIVQAALREMSSNGRRRRAKNRRPNRLDTAAQAGPRRRRAFRDQGARRHARARRSG